MKNFSHAININKGDNYLFNHTECDWAALRIGSLINIDNDQHFYTIGAVEPFNYITDFTIENTVENNDLIVNGNIENYLMLDDIIKVSYKEYELLTIKNILNKGQGYKINDILSCNGGNLSINIVNNASKNTLLKVEEVDNNGGIVKLSIIHKGLYINPPDNINNLIGGSGLNAQISLEYVVIPNRTMIDKQVLSVINSGPNTIVEIYGKMPEGVKNGKLSFSKYKAYLTSNYVGENKRNSNYHINRDVSPYLGLPLLLKGSNKSEEFYNHTILEIDKKLKDLQNQIDELKKK